MLIYPVRASCCRPVLWSVIGAGVLPLMILAGGCVGGLDGLVTGNGAGDDPGTGDLDKTSGEPNGSFEQATKAVFDDSGEAQMRGTVQTTGDLDVFLLGPLASGDRVVVDADTTGSALDVAVGIFDAQQRLVAENDDRSMTQLDSYLEFIVRHPGDSYYLVLTGSAFAGAGRHTGSYTVDVTVKSGSEVPAAVGQLLVLDFDGGSVDSPVLGSTTIAPFDATDIDPMYAGQTEAFKRQIRATVEQNFERYNVIIQTSDDPTPPSGVEFSTVYFGGFFGEAFGQAESIDLYNADFCDDAIIYTETFETRLFTFDPTVSQMSLAIGNVAAHEAGHLLGLNHVDDDRALMDDQSPADVFVSDQEFMEAPLSGDVMSIGTQDAVLLLSETVGLLR